MKRFSSLIAVALAASSLAAWAAELRVLSHSSFIVSKPLLAEFEKQNGAKVSIIKAGDA
ncbi:thiamine ABC transporter substrate-binding protein, partial [Pseudomonas sp. MWU13-2860]